MDAAVERVKTAGELRILVDKLLGPMSTQGVGLADFVAARADAFWPTVCSAYAVAVNSVETVGGQCRNAAPGLMKLTVEPLNGRIFNGLYPDTCPVC
jgi:hypothetical protein